MEKYNISEFRNKLATTFDQVDAGKTVLITRKRRTYMLIEVGTEELAISDELAKRINKAREEHLQGTALRFSSASEAQAWLDQL